MTRWMPCVLLLLTACGDDATGDASLQDGGVLDAPDSGTSDGGTSDVGDGGAQDAEGCTSDLDCDDGDPCTTDRCDPDGCATAAILCVDIRADTNRDGEVSLDDAGDDTDEDTWDATHGAILLPNLDDDAATCPTAGTLAELAPCNDAADEIVNGAGDLADLARLRVAPWPSAPDDAAARVNVDEPAADHVRLFILRDGSFVHWPAPRELTLEELRAGVEVAIEATDILRDAAIWDGFVDVHLEVDEATGPRGPTPASADQVRMRVAPLRMTSNLDGVSEVFAHARYPSLISELGAALPATVRVRTLISTPSSGFAGGYFRSAHLAMPAVGAPQTMRIALRGLIPESNAIVYSELRTAGFGAVEGFGATEELGDHASNLLMIPAHSHDGVNWPNGRALRASNAASGPGDLDPAFETMLRANGLGPSLFVDGSWMVLPSAHLMVSFVPSESPRGWAMLIADPALALGELAALQGDGHGATELFVGQLDGFGNSAAISIDQFLADVDLRVSNVEAAVILDDIRRDIQMATGLTDEEIFPVPALFRTEFRDEMAAFMPSLVSGMVLADGRYLTSDPFGPEIDGRPYFKDRFQAILRDLGLGVVFIDDWDVSLRLLGTLSNTINSVRVLPTAPIW